MAEGYDLTIESAHGGTRARVHSSDIGRVQLAAVRGGHVYRTVHVQGYGGVGTLYIPIVPFIWHGFSSHGPVC